VLGDVEETVYVVEEDEDEEDVVKASSPLSLSLPPKLPLFTSKVNTDPFPIDYSQEVRNVIRSR